MNKFKDIINIEIIHTPLEIPIPKMSFMEMWNPTVSDLKAIIPYLEEHKKILYVWCWGITHSDEYNYSGILSNHIVIPFWLGETQEEAYELYSKAFKNLVAGTMVNYWNFK